MQMAMGTIHFASAMPHAKCHDQLYAYILFLHFNGHYLSFLPPPVQEKNL